MLFSCKISNSFITFLDRRGEDLAQVYEQSDWPPEFLRDSSSWIEADKLEALLASLDREFGSRVVQGEFSLAEEVGHHSKDLHSWGVLDSVLRMVQTSKDLFAQPERLLSYFISPAPPIGEMKRGADSVSFVLPVSELQFPFVTAYLRTALESLPTYINKPMASVTWLDSRVTIAWSENQVSLFDEAAAQEMSLHPELVRNILLSLESSQKELEAAKQRNTSQEEELHHLREQLREQLRTAGQAEMAALPSADLIKGEIAECLHEIYRLGDYFARGQQLVTLLVAQGRQTPQVREAMRRVDWAQVVERAPVIIKEAIEQLQVIQEALQNPGVAVGPLREVRRSERPLERKIMHV